MAFYRTLAMKTSPLKKNFDIECKEHSTDYYRQAAENGQATAQYQLGLLYKQGKGGVFQDDALAIHWLRRAAEQGVVEAQNELGVFYQANPNHPQPDSQADAQAVEWFQNAATQDYAEAQYRLGLSYKVGRGVPKNTNQAKYWLQQAAEQGHQLAQDTLKMMPIPMTNRRFFLLLSSIGLAGSFFTLTGCGGGQSDDKRKDEDNSQGGGGGGGGGYYRGGRGGSS
jgi:TPR repeat protein